MSREKRLDLLDCLRLLAALMVVWYHYWVFGPTNGHVALDVDPVLGAVARYGYLGVDLFFLISGFVIMESARNKSASGFAVSRATRLYPAFWCAMLLTAITLACFGERVGLSVSLPQVLVNTTMAPTVLGFAPVDAVYWSLLYELEFYLLVFVLMCVRQGHRLDRLFPVWAMGMLACTIVAPDLAHRVPYLGGFFAYFAVGAMLSQIRYDARWTLLRVGGLASGLLVAGIWARQYADLVEGAIGLAVDTRVVWLIIAAWVAVVAAMLLRGVSSLEIPHSRRLGALTYPIYLLHAAIGYVIASFLIGRLAPWGALLLTFVAIWLLAMLLNRVERLGFWRRMFTRLLEPPPARRRSLKVNRTGP